MQRNKSFNLHPLKSFCAVIIRMKVPRRSNPRAAFELKAPLNSYLAVSDLALRDGAITPAEYSAFRRIVNLACYKPAIEDDDKKLREETDLTAFKNTAAKLDKYIKSPA